MWLVRALLHFLLTLVVALTVAVGVAALLALARGGHFAESLRVTSLALGGLLLLLATAGKSPSQRVLETNRIPGMPAWLVTQPEERTLSPGAVLFLTGLALLAFGLVVA